MNNYETRNPLIRDGVAQQQRQMPALAVDYAQVDERDLADFLVFAHELSQRVTYFNLQNQPEGNWHAFFERSTLVQIALISKTRPETMRDAYERSLRGFLAQWAIAPAASPSSPAERLKKIEPVLESYAQILDTLNTWTQGLAEGTPLKATIHASAKTNLPRSLRRLYRLEQGLSQLYQQEQHLTQRQSTESNEAQIQQIQMRLNAHDRRQAIYQQVATLLNVPGPLKQTSRATPARSDRTLAVDMRQLITNRVHAQAELNSIFQPLFQTYLQIIQRAPEALHQSLSADQSLEPHLALYVTFWEVLKPARADLNRMTQRHLDFFYRQVLRLSEQPAQPDKAHLILELAKFQQNYKLENQTRFSAGTDATGVELFYVLDEEIVVNTAQVAELKGIFLHGRQRPGSPTEKASLEILGIHASPVANSFDGQGSDFPKDQAVQAWLPFGDASRPAVTLGLAIASNSLLLQEGDRTVTFELKLNIPSASKDEVLDRLNKNLPHELRLEFSGETDWISGTITARSFAPSDNSGTNYKLTITVHLPVDAEPVLPYHADLPGGNLESDRPVARLMLRHHDGHSTTPSSEATQTEAGLSVYHYLREAQLEDITITTKVKGVQNLLLQNDLAILDATKPFLPFGIQPKIGTSFYIGSQEVFQKRLTHLKLSFDLETDPPRNQEDQIDWTKIYAGYGVGADADKPESKPFKPGVLAFHALRERQWHPPTSGIESNLFSQYSATSTPKYSIDLSETLTELELDCPVNSADAVPVEPWTYQSKYGFLRSQLTGDDFRHTDYPTVLARQVLATATQEIIEPPTDTKPGKRKAIIGAYYYRSTEQKIFQATTYYVGANDVPILPGEPYTPVIKSLQLDYTAKATLEDCQLFHLHPFDGIASLSDNLPAQPSVQSVHFLPHYDQEGELLIGLQNLEPSTSLTLLFQVAEETADTELERAKLHWHYLKDNTWQVLDEHLVLKDTSNGLIHSGIVKLAIPADISNAHTTVLNPALHWIKARVASRSRAVCQIISIQTQAVEVTFVDAGNDPNHLATPLPAATITKLANPQPEIKQIQQPYLSFGGTIQEQPAQFYTRVSEHLRHKGRAVTIFDYERLVLDRFPEIYKVRCINHGQVAADGSLSEITPGHVTLAVIPALSQRRTVNDLQPQVNINLLAEIEHYLKSLSSPWAKIRVVNPKYEQLWVQLKVQFRDPFQADFAFYQRQLERDIIGFLSPWTVDGGAEIHFGGEIYLASILNFVEERPYVDYVLDFHLFQARQSGVIFKATASSAQSILVSVPPEGDLNRHVIQPVGQNAPIRGERIPRKLGYGPLEQLLQHNPSETF